MVETPRDILIRVALTAGDQATIEAALDRYRDELVAGIAQDIRTAGALASALARDDGHRDCTRLIYADVADVLDHMRGTLRTVPEDEPEYQLWARVIDHPARPCSHFRCLECGQDLVQTGDNAWRHAHEEQPG